MAFFMVTLGVKFWFSSFNFVVGHVWLPILNHSSIDDFSCVRPSTVTTGSVMILRVLGSRKASGIMLLRVIEDDEDKEAPLIL